MPVIPMILTVLGSWLWYQAFVAWKRHKAGDPKAKTVAIICVVGAAVAMIGGVLGGLPK